MNAKGTRGPTRFPVMAGSQPAPRADRIAGIVERVWSDARVYHQDVEPLLREWLATDRCVVSDREFALLLEKARGEFDRVASGDPSGAPACPASALVSCLYWDVQRLERA
ncbi:hypothetical protein [Leifsonia sp. NPDC080035]|uniref:Uncharacterized protein n=1 Tax=Leifsonia sp. NPDC080035 TaxID=3143936 RepID=A0AAU7GH61_9MICO